MLCCSQVVLLCCKFHQWKICSSQLSLLTANGVALWHNHQCAEAWNNQDQLKAKCSLFCKVVNNDTKNIFFLNIKRILTWIWGLWRCSDCIWGTSFGRFPTNTPLRPLQLQYSSSNWLVFKDPSQKKSRLENICERFSTRMVFQITVTVKWPLGKSERIDVLLIFPEKCKYHISRLHVSI